MRIEGQLTERDFVTASLESIKPRRSFTVLGLALLALALWAEGIAILTWLRTGSGLGSVLGLGSALIALPVGTIWYVSWWAGRTYRSMKAASEPFSLETGPEGLRAESALGCALIPWNHVHRWREGRDCFLLHPADAFCYVVPKRFFESDDDLAAFRSLLAARVGSKPVDLETTADPH